jgi:hypothetical protein
MALPPSGQRDLNSQNESVGGRDSPPPDGFGLKSALSSLMAAVGRRMGRDPGPISSSEDIIKTMRAQAQSAEIQGLCCAALRNMACDSPSRVWISRHGGVEDILGAMRRFPKNEDLLEKASGVLWSLAVDRDVKVELGQADAVAVLISALGACGAQSSLLVEHVFGVFWNLALNNTENQQKMTEHHAVNDVIRFMAKFPDKASVQQYACGVLWNMALNDGNKRAIVENGGLDIILDAMRAHRSNCRLQWCACGALWTIAAHFDYQRILMEKNGVHELVVTMNYHNKDSSVQTLGCGALATLAMHDANQRPMQEENCAQCVVNALRVFPTDLELQTQGCSALRNLSRDTPDGAREVLTAGGIEALCTAVRAHPSSFGITSSYLSVLERTAVQADDAVVETLVHIARHFAAEAAALQQVGCAVSRLASLEENRLPLANSGIIEVLVGALQGHVHTGSATEHICQALLSLMSCAPAQKALANSKGLQAVFLAMEQQTASVQILSLCIAILSHLALEEDVRVLVGRSKGALFIVHLVRNHVANPDIVALGVKVLAILARNRLCWEQVADGHLDFFVDLMRRYSSIPEVQESVFSLMGMLLLQPDKISQRKKILDTILAGIARFSTNAVIQTKGLRVLLNFLQNKEMQKRVQPNLPEVLALVMAALRSFPANQDLVRICVGILCEVAADSESLRQMPVPDAVHELIRGIEAFPESATVACKCIVALRYMASAGVDHRYNIKVQALDLILSRMRSFPAVPEVQEQCAALLGVLCLSPENCRAVFHSGGALGILAAIRNFPLRSKLLGVTFAALWSMISPEPELQRAVARMDSLKVVMHALASHAAIEAVQMHGCALLRLLLSHDPRLKRSMACSGGVNIVLQAMRRFSFSAAVQEHCCGVVWDLVYNRESQANIASQGGIGDLICAMDSHPEETEVQIRACCALWNLAANNAENQRAILDRNGNISIMNALSRHMDNSSILQVVCKTLEILATSDAARQTFIQGGAVEIITKAVRLHPDSASVAERACGALSNLSGDSSSLIRMNNIDTVGVVINLLRRNHHNKMLLTPALLLLSNLARSDLSRERLTHLGTVHDLLGLMKRFVDDGQIVEPCLLVLWNLAEVQVYKDQMSSLPIAIEVVAGMLRHTANRSLQESACALLWSLSDCRSSNVRIIQAGTVPALVRAMQAHPTSQDLQLSACATLFNLSAHGGPHAVRQLALQPGLREALDQAVQHFPSNESLCKFARQLEVRLDGSPEGSSAM